MIFRRRGRLVAVAAIGALVVAACGSDNNSSGTTEAATATTGATATTAASTETTTGDTGTETTTAGTDAGSGAAWTVPTDNCSDPAAANAPIEGPISIGSVMPLSGGIAAIAFAPVADGFKAYIDYANANKIIPDHTLKVTIGDDQYNKDLTPGEVNKLLDAKVNLFSGIIGTPDNLAVRDTLNEECVPQLLALSGSPEWGKVADFPWTTGALIPYDKESKAYATQMKQQFPDGANVALFSVNSEFGQVYVDAFKELASQGGINIVEEQTIEATDESPPAAQVNAIAAKKPDAIMAAPLGAGCPTFLKAVADAKAANPGWNPIVYLTNTCASPLILGAAGPAANGLYTSANLKDIGNPTVQADPKVKPYVDFMTSKGKKDIITTAAAGWTTAEVTVAILKQAAASPDGLTRASIMNAARNFEYTPQLARDGVVDKMSGEDDPFLAESMQIVQYDATSKTFKDIGPLITDFESS
jgi:ABC-type branched-subunit amino acid transport system substrate-binding protein